MKPAELTLAISTSLPEMRKSERKVAEFILANFSEVIRMRIVDLAEAAEVSEPTVVRFCRAVGCDGFQAFKLALAQQLASSPSYGHLRHLVSALRPNARLRHLWRCRAG